MDEEIRAKWRDKVSGVAYILVAMAGFFFTAADYAGMEFNITGVYANVITEILIGITGLALLYLKKRDLTAMTMIMFSVLFLFYTVTGGVRFSPITFVLMWFFILYPLFLFTTREKKATSYFCVLFPYGIGAIGYVLGTGSVMPVVMHFIFSVLALYIAANYLIEKIQKPFALKLRSDENLQFEGKCPCLTFYIMAVLCLVTSVSIVTGQMDTELFIRLSAACGIGLIAISIIVYFYTSLNLQTLLAFIPGVMILAHAAFGSPDTGIGAAIVVIVGILFLAMTAFAIKVKKRILPAIMSILIGISFILVGFGMMNSVITGVLLGASGAIAIYMTLFTLNEKYKLPMI